MNPLDTDDAGASDAHASAAGQTPHSTEAVMPACVTVPRWRWRVYVHPASWMFGMFTMVVICILAAVIAGACFAVKDIAAPNVSISQLSTVQLVTIIVADLVIAAGVFGLAALLIRRAAAMTARAFEATIPASEPARGFMVAELQESGPPRDNWTKAKTKRWIRKVRSGSDTRAYLSPRIADRVAKFERTDRPLEPEQIESGMASGGRLLVIYVIICGFAVWRFGPFSPIVIGFGVGAILLLIRLIRRRALFTPVMVGQGWIQHGVVRWTVEDSVLFADGWLNSRVRVIGPHGVLTMNVNTKRGQNLECLWMRWMHPHPNLTQQAFDA
jgi:hypothetical protein